MQGRYNVLFLCTGNSARSIMAEAIMNHKGRPNFTAYSAGSHPAGRVNPYALKMIEAARLPTAGLRSKPWDEFAKPGAPELHFVLPFVTTPRSKSAPSGQGSR
jgi:arsenate reductase